MLGTLPDLPNSARKGLELCPPIVLTVLDGKRFRILAKGACHAPPLRGTVGRLAATGRHRLAGTLRRTLRRAGPLREQGLAGQTPGLALASLGRRRPLRTRPPPRRTTGQRRRSTALPAQARQRGVHASQRARHPTEPDRPASTASGQPADPRLQGPNPPGPRALAWLRVPGRDLCLALCRGQSHYRL